MINRGAVWWSRVLCLAVAWAAAGVAAAEPKTPADVAAEEDLDLARPELDRLAAITSTEIQRLLYDQPGVESGELKIYVFTPPARPIDLGDATIPLHVRAVERARRESAASIEFARKMAKPCGETRLQPPQFADAKARHAVLQAIECRRRQLGELQIGQHRLLLAHEAATLDLKLPPYTRERLLKQDRDYTLRDDADLEARYGRLRRALQASEDLVNFLESHAAHLHLVDGRVVYDEPGAGAFAQTLQNQVLALTK